MHVPFLLPLTQGYAWRWNRYCRWSVLQSARGTYSQQGNSMTVCLSSIIVAAGDRTSVIFLTSVQKCSSCYISQMWKIYVNATAKVLLSFSIPKPRTQGPTTLLDHYVVGLREIWNLSLFDLNMYIFYSAFVLNTCSSNKRFWYSSHRLNSGRDS